MSSIRPGRSPVEERLRRAQALPEAAAHGRPRTTPICGAAGGAARAGVRGHGVLRRQRRRPASAPRWRPALGVRAGQCAPDGAVSLQAVHCLGYCYAGPAALDGDTPRAGADLADQLAGRAAPRAPADPGRGRCTEPVVLRGVAGRRSAAWQVWPAVLRGGAARERVAARGGGVRAARAGRRGLPGGAKWAAVRGRARRRTALRGGQRRRGRPGLLRRPAADGARPGAGAGGPGAGRLRLRRHARAWCYVRSEYPRALARDAGGGRAGHGRRAPRPRRARHGVDFDVEVVAGAGSYVAGEETVAAALDWPGCAARCGRARRTRPSTGCWGAPTAVNNVETLAAVPGDRAPTAARRTPGSARPPRPGTQAGLPERAVRPARRVRGRARHAAAATSSTSSAAGCATAAELRALQVGGPLGGFLGPDAAGPAAD